MSLQWKKGVNIRNNRKSKTWHEKSQRAFELDHQRQLAKKAKAKKAAARK
jgi:hypothetical protein